MDFNYKPVTLGEIKTEKGSKEITGNTLQELVMNAKYGERNLEKTCERLRGKSSFFNYCFIYDDEVAPTITAHANNIRWDNKQFPSKQDIISMSTFPQDYNFKYDSIDNVSYICGMSVPPIMIKRISLKLIPLIKESKEKYDERN